MINDKNVIVFDIDGTLCSIKSPEQNYEDVSPEPLMIARMRELEKAGWHIILQTSRNMRTYGGNVAAINAKMLPALFEWLSKHDVPYHEIHTGKPWPGRDGVYVDDRSVRPREFLEHSIDELHEICTRDRIA